jgi:hypothetical protein
MFKATVDGAVELYYDNSKKFETNAEGVRINGYLEMLDDQRIQMGTGDDLQIYHSSSDNDGYIKELGTGRLQIWTDSLHLKNQAGNEHCLVTNEDGNVELWYDNVKRFETSTDGVLVSGRIAVGAAAANNKINVLGAAGNNQTTLYYGFGTIDLTSASDERVKNNVVPTAKGLDDILKLRIVDFTYTPEYAEDSTTVRTGGIAQEWQKVDPNLVNAENKDLLLIEYKKVIPHLIKAVQELSAEVAALKAA